MFSALTKAFTGRAGFLPSLLALIIIILIAAAVILNLPRIEQNLVDESQTILQENMSDGDKLVSLRAEGRNLILEGEFSDEAGLAAKLEENKGVRSVIFNGGTAAVQEAQPEQTITVSDIQESVADGGNPAQNDAVSHDASADDDTSSSEITGGADAPEDVVVASGEPMTNSSPEIADTNTETGTEGLVVNDGETDATDQSSLTLRYDGTQLSLSGHLADEQMAQLIADEVSRAIPGYSELNVSVAGNGKSSPLNWMDEFLAAVAGLPDDAQGVIEGSDALGVQIVPDAEQTLREKSVSVTIEPAGSPELSPENGAIDEGTGPGDQVQSELSSSGAMSMNAGAELKIDTDAQVDNTVSGFVVETDGQAVDAPAEDEAVAEVPVADESEPGAPANPGKFIIDLNKRVATQQVFESGEHKINAELAAELDGLADMMHRNPTLLVRVVGNLDFSVEPRRAEFVGIDRAREVRNYLQAQNIERFRVLATPLPREYAFDKRVQVVFYISE